MKRLCHGGVGGDGDAEPRDQSPSAEEHSHQLEAVTMSLRNRLTCSFGGGRVGHSARCWLGDLSAGAA